MPRLPGGPRSRDSDTSDVCVCAAIRLLARFASLDLSRVLLAQGSTLTEFHLLVALQLEPAAQTVLARTLHIDAGAVSRTIRRLAREGNVEPTGTSRQAFWRLTEFGRMRLQFLTLGWDAADARMRSFLDRLGLLDPLLSCTERLPVRWRAPAGAWRD
jgi:DNA-binding MarR family transcriptional regulator